MIPTTPYLVRAIYEWCTDQGFTPHLLVDASEEGVVVPEHLVENDTIVLNIQASAIRSLELGNDWIIFNARFSGQAMDISVPMSAVRAIFARENGLGCAFEATAELSPEEAAEALDEINAEIQQSEGSKKKEKPAKSQASKQGANRPNLKLVD